MTAARHEPEVRRPDGTVLFADVLRLHPGNGDNPTSIGLLGHHVVATFTSSRGRRNPPVSRICSEQNSPTGETSGEPRRPAPEPMRG